MIASLLPWSWKLWLATNWGWYKYAGIWSMAPKNFPRGRVLYRDGFWSADMALGNAVDYAGMFGGTVHPTEK
jgi:hypothetical protein